MYVMFSPGELGKTYSTVPADVNLEADCIALGNNNVPRPTKFMRVGTGGDVAVMLAGGVIVVIPGMLAGESIPIGAIRLLSSANGTTATNITFFW